MIFQNNDTIAANARRRNQEQRVSRWTENEKCILAFSCLCFWSLIGITMFCFYQQYSASVELKNGVDDDFGLWRWKERLRESWRTALYDYVNQDANKTAALVDENVIKCPRMYSLSKNNKLCYFLAKTRDLVHFDYLPLLVNKSQAVTFCNNFSNGTVPYGEFLLNLYK